jgi:hypothetical protein
LFSTAITVKVEVIPCRLKSDYSNQVGSDHNFPIRAEEPANLLIAGRPRVAHLDHAEPGDFGLIKRKILMSAKKSNAGLPLTRTPYFYPETQARFGFRPLVLQILAG